ncbi:hypothetical protein CPB86DRAFT_796347 [Serendipita vermifera]|nr:hypothetical protein CPB86DRAFT_796347 [Serendipita vermifera]
MASVTARKGPAAQSPPLHPMGGSLKRSSSRASLTDPKPKRKRTKQGCITCRVRGKKCDEQRVDDGETCETCKRLRLYCLGFQDRRPDWLRSKENIQEWRKRVKDFLLSQGLVKGHAGCGLRPGNAPDSWLSLDDMRRDLDVGGVDAGPDSPSGPLRDEDRDLEPEGFGGSMLPSSLTLPPLQNIPRSASREPDDSNNLSRRFGDVIAGLPEENRQHRWVPPPPYGPMKREYELPSMSNSRPGYNGTGPYDPSGMVQVPPVHHSPYDSRYDREVRPSMPMHSTSGGSFSSSSGIETKPGSHYRSSSFTNTPDANTLPPLNSLVPAHNRDRSDPIYGNDMSGSLSSPSSYGNLPSSNGSRSNVMYNQSNSGISSSSGSGISPYPYQKSAPPYPLNIQPVAYGPALEAGQSSVPGPDRYAPRPNVSSPTSRHDPYSHSHRHHEAPSYHPYRQPSHRSSTSSRNSDGSPPVPHPPLSIRTGTRPSNTISPTNQYPPQSRSLESASTSSPEMNPSYGAYMPQAASGSDSYGTYPSVPNVANVGMSIQNLLQASNVSTPMTGPPSSALSTVTATPTTYTNESTQNERNPVTTTTEITTYIQGYPSNWVQYGPNQPMMYDQLTIQPSPTISASDFYIQRYFTNVIGVQYRLANHQTLPNLMWQLSERSPAVKASISLLSVLYFEAQQLAENGLGGSLLGNNGHSGVLGENETMAYYPSLDLGVPGIGFINSSALIPSNTTNSRAQYDLLYARIKKLLDEAKITKGERYDEGDAMACLHVISAFLFSGGHGNWDQFLQIAAHWVWGRISDYSGDVGKALGEMNSMDKFIFRTTMWMDVFGSISLCRSPRFLGLYQTLFVPGALDTMSGQSIETNMDRVMGCPNEIILAFAQIAHLEARKGELVKRLNNGLGMSGPGGIPTSYPGAPGWSYLPADSPELWRQEMESLEAEGIQIERQIPETYGPAALPMERIVEIQEVPRSNVRAVYPSVPKEATTSAASMQNIEFIDSSLFDSFSWVDSQSGMGQASLQSSGTTGLETEDPIRQGGYVDPDEDKRGKIAEVFKNTARLYLYSVIFGSDPLVPKTRRAVQATIRSLEFNWPIGSVVYRTGQSSSTGS